MTAYKTTGLFIVAIKRLLGFRVRITGGEHLPDRPTLFVVNHFTRFETVMVPYAVYQAVRRPVKTLATHSIFRGLMAKYFDAVGVVSVRDPRRNRMIISDLMTGASDWVIYPEGGLIKNKKTTRRGRLQLERPERRGPPHTGAAILALKSEICKKRYLDACAQHDERRRAYYEEQFDVHAPEQLPEESAVVVPVTITYHAYHPRPNVIQRLARLVSKAIDPRFEEELTVEGSMLLGRTEMNIHFGEPIEVAAYLDRGTELVRRLIGVFSEGRRTNLGLRRQATRLTDDAMRSLYSHIEINFEHLFCYGLAALRRDSVEMADFRSALYLAAAALQARPELRLHYEMRNGVAGLVTGNSFAPLERAEARALREGVINVERGRYLINREALVDEHDFHRIRLERMVRVLANEFESIEPAAALVRRVVNQGSARIARRVLRAMLDEDRAGFARDYEEWFEDGVSKDAQDGEPFFLRSRGSRQGAVLVHGYLAAPRQMQEMAEFLHARGWNVYAVRLPGHGTSPRHLADVVWEEWLSAVRRGCAIVKQHCETVVIGGFSLGGILALLAAADEGVGVDAVFSINAPFKLRDRRAWLVHPIAAWHRMLARIGVGNGHLNRASGTEDPALNYPEYSLASVRELRQAVATCRRKLEEISAPTLLLQSSDDPVVDPAGAHHALKRLASTQGALVEHPCGRHVIVRGGEAEPVLHEIDAFLRTSLERAYDSVDVAADA